MSHGNPSTGIPGLDRVYRGLRLGDNVVFQTLDLQDYRDVVQPFVRTAVRAARRVIYVRFGQHAPVVEDTDGVEVHTVSPTIGFQAFAVQTHRLIQQGGRGAFYVFDNLSELAKAWHSDEMMGNWFILTCPYLFDLETVAYFTLVRGAQSVHATKPIMETTQIFSDLFRLDDRRYVHPVKVQQRYSPSMHMLHRIDGDRLDPVTDSMTMSEVMAPDARAGIDAFTPQLDIWNREFLHAEREFEEAARSEGDGDRAAVAFRQLLGMAISHDEAMLALAEQHLQYDDILHVGRRIIGTGLIGGKAVGMLLAHAILRGADPRWQQVLEQHDSFYVGSDVFFTFLVRNGIWWVRSPRHTVDDVIEDAERSRRRILTGTFPDHIQKQFEAMLDYFGQSPIIVRSSSLQEDNFGNSFVGKYESVFCPNQGLRSERIADFLSAVRTVYASSLSEKAIRYRARRGILDAEERMGLLVQRVSGKYYEKLFYPEVAGVGYSYNPYIWSENIDPNAGVIRIVFGLGTRAVDRAENDYTRVVALDQPGRRPEADYGEKIRYTQHNCDVLDLNANQIEPLPFEEVVARSPQLPLDLYANQDRHLQQTAQRMGRPDAFTWSLSFNKLFTRTNFIADMREILGRLQAAYGCPVDIEFTANAVGEADYRINLVQCRPLQLKEGGAIPEIPEDLKPRAIVLRSRGGIVGHSRECHVDRVVYVLPDAYTHLSGSERVSLARVLGQLMHLEEEDPPEVTMLLGPGRWGSSTPSLGVPVRFSEINSVSILCEVVPVSETYAPQVSLGTHFFSELVEMDILYLAVFPQRGDTVMDTAFWEQSPNVLTRVLPGAGEWEGVVKVIDLRRPTRRGRLKLVVNALKQLAMCYWDRTPGPGSG